MLLPSFDILSMLIAFLEVEMPVKEMTFIPSGFGDEWIQGIRVLLVDTNSVQQLLFGKLIHLFVCQV